MMLQTGAGRKSVHDYLLGSTTALVAGLVNVCSVMAFFAFSSNVTGHVAVFAQELAHGKWHQVWVVLAWMSAFMLGAFLANFVVIRLEAHKRLAGSLPLALEVLILALTAYYGQHHYLETLRETELMVGALLFAMGIQNGTVSTVSNSIVRTTHLTGLFTDLGMEISLFSQPRFRSNPTLRFKLKLHLLILGGYLVGGTLSGLLYDSWGFSTLYLATAILLSVVLHDLLVSASSSIASAQLRPAPKAAPVCVDAE